VIPTVSSNVFDIIGASRRSPGSDCRRQIVTTITSFLSDYCSDDYRVIIIIIIIIIKLTNLHKE